MARPFQFPKHPNSDRTNPFDDGQGQNPYAEEQPAQPVESDSAENPYGTSPAGGSKDDGPAYRPVHETFAQPRGGFIVTIGLIGCGLAALGAIGASLTGLDEFGWWVNLTGMGLAPLAVFCLIFTVPAWMMGSQDLKAMDSGAMFDHGRGTTNVGAILGIIGTLLGVCGCAIYVYRMFITGM